MNRPQLAIDILTIMEEKKTPGNILFVENCLVIHDTAETFFHALLVKFIYNPFSVEKKETGIKEISFEYFDHKQRVISESKQ